MPQLSDFARPHMHVSDPDPEMTLQWMARQTQIAQQDASLRLFAEKLIQGVFPHDYLSEYAAVNNWVRMHIRYSRDPITIEQVKTPQAVLETETGDCMTLDTRVIVRDRRGFYRLRTLGQLRDCYEDFSALSYDFAAGNFVFRSITRWLDKGVRPTVELQLRGGIKVHATPDHKFFVWKRHKQRVEIRSVEDFWLEDHLPQGCSLLCARGPIPTMLPTPATLTGRKVEKHGGLGRHGIWRLWEAVGAPHPAKKRFAPAGLYGCHVDDIIDVGPQPVCDITVDDTHNFVTADGVVAHNCDDMCVLIGALVGTLGARVRFVAGGFVADSLSHVWCEAWEPNVKAWVVLDPVPGRRVGQMLGKLVETKMIKALE